ncbi:pectate lyase [Echinicola sediminis]
MKNLTLIGPHVFLMSACLFLMGCFSAFGQSKKTVSWKQAQRQEETWYGSAEAQRIADNVLLYQHDNGGWYKNIDMAKALSEKVKEELLRARSQKTGTTIDNGATFTQLRYLAKVFQATDDTKYKVAFLRGVDYLLEAQYANGGWPQYYPIRQGYYEHITFNDGAMIGVMGLLKEIAEGKEAYGFVDQDRRERAKEAIDQGLQVILKCQVKIEGKRTIWCAQHDKESYQPAKARAYELPTLSGSESVGILRYLMSIPDPDDELIEAVESAIAWLNDHKIEGIRLVREENPDLPKGYDLKIVEDPNAGPLWARFYDLHTQQPVFVGRDGVKKAALAEIEYERRVGYSYLGNYAEKLLDQNYPEWKSKMK